MTVRGVRGTASPLGAFLYQWSDPRLEMGLQYGLDVFFKKAGLDSVQKILDSGKTQLELPCGALAKGQCSQKIYRTGDRQILSNDVRRLCEADLRKERVDFIWVETNVSAELSDAQQAERSLLGRGTLSGACNLLSELRYRRLEPYASLGGQLPKGAVLSNAALVPVTADLAIQMPKGAEFEITGNVGVNAKPEFCFSIPFMLGRLSSFVKTHLGLSGGLQKGISIYVQKLMSENQVLVKISKRAEKSAACEASLGTSGSFPIQETPLWSKIKFVLDKLGFTPLLKWLCSLFSSSSSSSMNYKNENYDVESYVLDLSEEEHRKQYESIFKKISSTPSELVPVQRISNQEKSFSYGGDIDWSLTKVLLMKSLQSEKEGKINKEGSQSSIYRESKFEKEYSGWFSGAKSIRWESVSVVDGQSGEKKEYYHLLFHHLDRITEHKEIDDLLGFMASLGINPSEDVKKLFDVFSDRDDAETHVDLYFTKEGVKRICEAKSDPKDFFTRMGNQKGFDFMQTIAEMAQIAGPEETLIHELSISGGGIIIKTPDEGEIMHPERALACEMANLGI